MGNVNVDGSLDNDQALYLGPSECPGSSWMASWCSHFNVSPMNEESSFHTASVLDTVVAGWASKYGLPDEAAKSPPDPKEKGPDSSPQVRPTKTSQGIHAGNQMVKAKKEAEGECTTKPCPGGFAEAAKSAWPKLRFRFVRNFIVKHASKNRIRVQNKEAQFLFHMPKNDAKKLRVSR